MSTLEYRVGTASWTDPTLVKSDLFYPPSILNPEQRLRFYAERFDTVEVDSRYYVLPAERNSLWAERTPAGFLFNVKPFKAGVNNDPALQQPKPGPTGELPA